MMATGWDIPKSGNEENRYSPYHITERQKCVTSDLSNRI
jgi:hypothetical protein